MQALMSKRCAQPFVQGHSLIILNFVVIISVLFPPTYVCVLMCCSNVLQQQQYFFVFSIYPFHQH